MKATKTNTDLGGLNETSPIFGLAPLCHTSVLHALESLATLNGTSPKPKFFSLGPHRLINLTAEFSLFFKVFWFQFMNGGWTSPIASLSLFHFVFSQKGGWA